MKELSFRNRYGIPQPLNVGAVRRIADVPRYPGLQLIAVINEVTADVEIHREVSAQKLDPYTALLQRFFDETAAFGLIRTTGLDGEAFTRGLDNSNVDTGPTRRNRIQNVIQRPGHIECRTHTGQSNHPLRVGMPKNGPHVRVHIDDAGNDVLS